MLHLYKNLSVPRSRFALYLADWGVCIVGVYGALFRFEALNCLSQKATALAVLRREGPQGYTSG